MRQDVKNYPYYNGLYIPESVNIRRKYCVYVTILANLIEAYVTAFWYAIRSKPNKEDFLSRQLEAAAVPVFYPRLHVSPANPRSRKFKPYFPGYLFIQVDFDVVNASTLQWMPGAANLVSFGGEPSPVPEQLILAVQRRVSEINASNKTRLRDLKPGEAILINEGVFAGYEAIFDSEVSGQERVRVLLNFLQKRQVALELQSSQIGRVKRG